MAAPNPPKHLSAKSKRLWRKIVADYELEHEAHAMETLRLACEALDRCEQARQALDRDGLTVPTGDGSIKTHPCVAIERDSRIAALRAFRELALDGEPPVEDNSRPPRLRVAS